MQSTLKQDGSAPDAVGFSTFSIVPKGLCRTLKPVSLWSDGKMLKAAMVAQGPDESPVRSAGLSNVLVRRALAKHPTASRAQILVP
jgi:hypothetical protein